MYISFIICTYHWNESMFRSIVKTVPNGYWDSISNQRHFLDEFMQKNQIKQIQITTTLLQKHGGSGVLTKYGGSVVKMLSTLYPDYKQMCRDWVVNVVHELKLKNTEDIVNVPQEYHEIKKSAILVWNCSSKPK